MHLASPTQFSVMLYANSMFVKEHFLSKWTFRYSNTLEYAEDIL